MKRTLLLAALLGSGCSEGPCGQGEGPVFYATNPNSGAHTDGYNPMVFDSIGEAVDQAPDNATVCIGPGAWQETLRIETPGLRLVGTGVGRTILAPRQLSSDPRESSETLIVVDAPEVEIQGMTLQGAQRGIDIRPEGGVLLRDLEIRTNNLGIFSETAAALALENVELIRNVESGAIFSHNGGSPTWVSLRDTVFEGNGNLAESQVGGLISDHPLVIDGLLLRSNGGTEAADLWAHQGLEGRNLEIQRPVNLGNAPQLRVSGDLDLSESLIALQGGAAIQLDCDGGRARLENVAISDSAWTASDHMIQLEECAVELDHLTLVQLTGPAASLAVRVSGAGDIQVKNSAFIGFESWLLDTAEEREVDVDALFFGSLVEAQLIRPFADATNLEPQLDSPLLDGGVDSKVAWDLRGQARPAGAAPDIGAYERQ